MTVGKRKVSDETTDTCTTKINNTDESVETQQTDGACTIDCGDLLNTCNLQNKSNSHINEKLDVIIDKLSGVEFSTKKSETVKM